MDPRSNLGKAVKLGSVVKDPGASSWTMISPRFFKENINICN